MLSKDHGINRLLIRHQGSIPRIPESDRPPLAPDEDFLMVSA
jgi:hypothetical protein